MRGNLRLTTVLTLLVIFLVAGLLPAAGSWSCPDGTACVYTRHQGLHCAEKPCAMPCCAAHRRGNCCAGRERGLLAAAVPAARTRRPSPLAGTRLSTTGPCRYRAGRQLGPVLTASRLALDVPAPAVAVRPAPVEITLVKRWFTLSAPARGSPCSSAILPSLPPRAPPQPDRA